MSPIERLRKLFKKNRRKNSKGKYPSFGRREPKLEAGKRPSYHRYQPRRGILGRLVKYGLIFGLLLVAWFSYDLPDIEELDRFTKAPSILIKSEDGRIIGSFGDIYGDYVSFQEFPASLVDAVIATEDRNFYYHFGIDPVGLLRATIANIRAGHVVQGGSTITQQVAKNVFLTPERSLNRKIREMLLAFRLEYRFTKQDILSIYLNRVYLGAGNYGVDAASRRYFGKSARELTLSESAILAGLLKAPSRFAPTSNPALSKQRADQVLLNMLDAGYLTQEQCDKARAELEQAMSGRQRSSQSTLYFADWIADQLPEIIANVQEDIIITTTLNPELQAMADKAIAGVMDAQGVEHEASQAALLAMTPDGAVRAMVGGRNYGISQFNRTTQSLRQPGSSFKLFVYLAGLESGLTPGAMVEDQPITVPIVGGEWQPKNYTNKYLGTLTLKDAVTESINTVAVQVALYAGLDKVTSVARRLGITSDLLEVPSLALGATEVTLLELTTAYAHLAANGAIVYPYGISEIATARDNIPLYKRHSTRIGRVLSSDTVGMMNEMLMNVVTSGTGRAAQIGRPAAGKTGTTSDYRDAWFMGFTPDLVAGVWVGNDDNTPMKKVTGGMLPASIWREFMRPALASVPASDIPTGGFFGGGLPWHGGAPEFPVPPSERGAAPAPSHERVLRERPEQGAPLGQSFWEKLMGAPPQDNSVKRQYPGQRQKP